MNDRELLELASKAWIRSGMRLECPDDDDGIYVCRDQSRNGHTWNPLTDDGDALRLAVGLNLLVDSDGHTRESQAMGQGADEWVQHGKNKFAATRLAIVRAAADIGRRMS